MIKGPGGILKTGSESLQPDPDRINLKNGRARQPYQTSIAGYSRINVRDNGGTALTISPEGEVSGDATAAGEYTLILDALKVGQPVVIRVRLSIIADPRDLWKAIASDQSAPMAKVDEAFDSQLGEAFIVAASKRGRSHAQEGKYREDDFSIHADTETGWHILVVADGAGSADLSREGSRIACEVVISSLPRLLAENVDPQLEAFVAEYDENFHLNASMTPELLVSLVPSSVSGTVLGTVPAPVPSPVTWALNVRKKLLYPVLPKVALQAARAIELEAKLMERKPQDFSTTIVIALSKKVLGKWFTASFTVGDGGVAIFDRETNQVAVLCRPDSGEFAGQTRFLATSEFDDSEDVLGRIFVDVREHFTVLAAMTDGITDPKFPTDSIFKKPEIWSDFWAEDICKKVSLRPDNPDVKEQMLSWLDFWSRGNHDDRTIALMLPK